ncbi:MAG: N-acetyl-D-glucosamine ABC transporter, permease protein 2, partial [uncultured Thermomicrobiales bacterium]
GEAFQRRSVAGLPALDRGLRPLPRAAPVGAGVVAAAARRNLPVHDALLAPGALPDDADPRRLPGDLLREGVRPGGPEHGVRRHGNGPRRPAGRRPGRVCLRPPGVSRQAAAVRSDGGHLHGAVRGDRDPPLRPGPGVRLGRHLPGADRAGGRQRDRHFPLPPVLLRDPERLGRRRPARRRELAGHPVPDLPAAVEAGHDRGVAAAVPLPVGVVPVAADRGPLRAVQGGPGGPLRLPDAVHDALERALRGVDRGRRDPAPAAAAAAALLRPERGRDGAEV